jgi:hypothetical protein
MGEEGGRPMKALIFAAVVAVGLVLALGRTNDGAQHDPGWKQDVQQSAQQVDSYLQRSLTPDTQAAITKHARDSADWLKGLGKQAAGVTD